MAHKHAFIPIIHGKYNGCFGPSMDIGGEWMALAKFNNELEEIDKAKGN
jgi:hypothetical protein